MVLSVARQGNGGLFKSLGRKEGPEDVIKVEVALEALGSLAD